MVRIYLFPYLRFIKNEKHMKTQIVYDGLKIAEYDFALPLNENDVITYKGVQWAVKYKHLNISLNIIYIYI